MSLRVLTNIPYGNACNVSVIQEDEGPLVSFAADPHGGPESLWFCLRLEESSPGRKRRDKVKLVLKHLDSMLGASDPEKIRPVTRSPDGDWERLPPGIPQCLSDGRRNAVWYVDHPDPTLDIALCYPYGRSEIEALITDTGAYWKLDEIGVSQEGRSLIRLCNYTSLEEDERPGVFIVARQHSGETPGSWVMDGFLRHVATLGDAAPLVWSIPLAHIDGVEGGDYGKDGFPYDLNRAWGDPPMRHEILVYKRDLGRWIARCRPFMGMDFHAPGCCETGGIYAFLPNPDQFEEAHRRATETASHIGKVLGKEYASESFERIPTYLSRWETPGFTSHCCTQGFFGLTLETPYSQAGDLVLTREHYREAGTRIARAVLELLERYEGP